MGLFDFLKKDTKTNNGNYRYKERTSNDKYHYKEVVVYNPPRTTYDDLKRES